MKKILFIEDDDNLIKSFGDEIKKDGIDFIYALNGEDGVKMAKKEKVDLILLDIILPKKSGFDVLKEIKEDETIKNTPVIILTNLEEEKDIEKALSYGAYTYLVKANYSLNDIIKKVKEVLEK